MRIAFVSYETPYAPAGGIAAVMGKLPQAMNALRPGDITVVTPFHHQIPDTAKLAFSLEFVAEFEVSYKSHTIKIRLLRGPNNYLFLRPDGDQYFAGTPHPYLVADSATLRRDALLFGVATWRALKIFDSTADWVLFLQDWQAATTALSMSEADSRPRMLLTLHNSYDTGVTDDHLEDFGISPSTCPGHTALTRALPLLEPTVATVSGQFAADLFDDPLQTKVLADHLGGPLSGRVIGVNNGPFVKLEVPEDVLIAGAKHDFDPLRDWKHSNRTLALEALRSFEPSPPERPFWGTKSKVLSTANSDIPWFVMAGRDDSRQKGYDVAVEAVRSFLSAGGKACFFFFPIPGDEGLAGLSFLEDLALDFPEFVGCFPFRWKEGYAATLRGASFGLMPSFYEPFGMANEFYLSGTLGIGRATGGLVQQIVPLKSCASFSVAAENIANCWHSWSAPATGLLYRESLTLAETIDSWKRINEAGYERTEQSTQRMESRHNLPLFRSMVVELVTALSDACEIHRDDEAYGQMLVNGVRHIKNAFSWQRAAYEYGRAARLFQD